MVTFKVVLTLAARVYQISKLLEMLDATSMFVVSQTAFSCDVTFVQVLPEASVTDDTVTGVVVVELRLIARISTAFDWRVPPNVTAATTLLPGPAQPSALSTPLTVIAILSPRQAQRQRSPGDGGAAIDVDGENIASSDRSRPACERAVGCLLCRRDGRRRARRNLVGRSRCRRRIVGRVSAFPDVDNDRASLIGKQLGLRDRAGERDFHHQLDAGGDRNRLVVDDHLKAEGLCRASHARGARGACSSRRS